MPTEDNPTGLSYLKTFQALFQIIELIVLLLTWSLLASQPFYLITSFSFSLGVFLTVWLITLFFFVTYITGLHLKINDLLANAGSSGQTASQGTAGSLAPPPEARQYISKGVVWFAAEYIIYLICDILVFIADCIVSSKPLNGHIIAAAVFGWIGFLVYLLHFCLLVKNTEGSWPHTFVVDRCKRTGGQKKTTESEGLIATTSAPTPEGPEQTQTHEP